MISGYLGKAALERPKTTKAVHAAQTDGANADLTVVGGAGHVGIPLVLAFAEAGLTVNVNDLNAAVLLSLQSGKLPFIEHGAAPLLAKALANNRLGLHVFAGRDYAHRPGHRHHRHAGR